MGASLIVCLAMWLAGCQELEPTELPRPTTPPTKVVSFNGTLQVQGRAANSFSVSQDGYVEVVGQTQTFTLSATTTPTTVISSNTTVLTIDEGGNATAVGVGTATVTATGDDGQTATLAVQVVPVYQGNWVGIATAIACTELAGFIAVNYCAQNLGVSKKVTLALSQNGLSVTGSMTKAEGTNLLNGSVGGVINANGDITLSGTLAGLAGGSNFQLALISWNSIADGSQMTGTLAGNVTSQQITGIATVQWALTAQAVP